MRADLVTFTEEILNRKLHFFWAVSLHFPSDKKNRKENYTNILNIKACLMKPFFTYRALQPLSPIFKIILTVFCAWILISIGIFVTTNQSTNPPVPLSIEWSLICSRLKKIDWDFVSLINISFKLKNL